MAVKISGMMGTGSMGHNNRKFITENVDPARTEQNITLCRENLKQVYHELFDEALAEYNAKKTKTRDKIPDYYRHIEKSKQERLFHEVIFQIGNKDNCGNPCCANACFSDTLFASPRFCSVATGTKSIWMWGVASSI